MPTRLRFPDECAFLPDLIGEFTSAIMAFVRQTHANARFEVLYPPDVNDTPLNQSSISRRVLDAGKPGVA